MNNYFDAGNFNTVFNNPNQIPVHGYDPKSGFNNHGFMNRNNLLSNNLCNNLLDEEITEYSVLIDSKDRNYQVYPDPFKYTVKFNPLRRTTEIIDGEKVVNEEPMPVINDNFKNVKYIRLESIILPFYTKIRFVDEDIDGDIVQTAKVNTSKPLTDNLYVLMHIEEFKGVNYKSSNDVLAESFAVIYFDNKISNTHYEGKCNGGIKIFPSDKLGTINSLKISFVSPYGEEINCDHLMKEIKSNMICNCDDPEGDEYTDCFKHNLFHPLNPIFQHHVHFKIGVVTPRLNKLNFN